MSNAGHSLADDTELFPSDEQLSQRALWIAFVIVAGWTLLGLAGALPLYLVSMPCLADLPPPAVHSGFYSTIQDLSLLHLLRVLDDHSSTSRSSAFGVRAVSDGHNITSNMRVRIIVLTVLVVVLGVFPALWKIIKEFNRVVAYRRRWVEVRCQGKEMGWLSARKAPGFLGWGEKRLKSFLLKNGLSASLETDGSRNNNNESNQARPRPRRRRTEDEPLTHSEESNLEIDIQSLFSIG